MIDDDEMHVANCDFEYEKIAPVAEVEPHIPIQSFNAFLARETEITDQDIHH